MRTRGRHEEEKGNQIGRMISMATDAVNEGRDEEGGRRRRSEGGNEGIKQGKREWKGTDENQAETK